MESNKKIQFPTIILTIAVIMSACTFVWQGYALLRSYQSLSDLVQSDLNITRLASEIVYYDEVLTMTARINAMDNFSGWNWKRRYAIYEQKLETAIENVENISIEYDYNVKHIEQTFMANERLVELEQLSFDAVDQGEFDKAQSYLFNDEYQREKQNYANGIHNLLDRLSDRSKLRLDSERKRTEMLIIFTVCLILVLTVIWFYALTNVRKWKQSVEKSNADILAAKEAIETSLDHLEEANKEVERFNYVVAHDLKEPLRSIYSFSQLIEEKNEDPEISENINIIKRATNRMRMIIDDLLSFAKLTKSDCTFEDIDTSHEMKFIVSENLDAVIKESNGSVTFDNLPVMVADRMKFILISQNLITNALKFNRTDRPEITITAHERENVWEFQYKDNGIGVPKEFQSKIFDPFYRLHDQRNFKGSGIGLAICKKLVQKMGGEIWVESDGENGSCFYVTYPKLTPTKLENFS